MRAFAEKQQARSSRAQARRRRAVRLPGVQRAAAASILDSPALLTQQDVDGAARGADAPADAPADVGTARFGDGGRRPTRRGTARARAATQMQARHRGNSGGSAGATARACARGRWRGEGGRRAPALEAAAEARPRRPVETAAAAEEGGGGRAEAVTD